MNDTEILNFLEELKQPIRTIHEFSKSGDINANIIFKCWATGNTEASTIRELISKVQNEQQNKGKD